MQNNNYISVWDGLYTVFMIFLFLWDIPFGLFVAAMALVVSQIRKKLKSRSKS